MYMYMYMCARFVVKSEKTFKDLIIYLFQSLLTFKDLIIYLFQSLLTRFINQQQSCLNVTVVNGVLLMLKKEFYGVA